MEPEEHFDKAVGHIVAIAKLVSPSEPRKAVELILLSAFSYCRHELKMSNKEACDSIDMLLVSLFEQIDPETPED